MLTAVCHNQNQGKFDISAFEIGQIHFREGFKFIEKTSLGIILTGDKTPYHFESKSKAVDFFDLKGILETLFSSFLTKNVEFHPSSFETFHPKRQAQIVINDKPLGVIGELHPSLKNKLDLKSRVLFAEIDLQVLEKISSNAPQYEPLPTFPGSERDWTITMKRSTDLGAMLAAIRNFDSNLLKKYELLDIYQGPNVSESEKNVTLRFYYRDDAKTLDIESVETEHSKLTSYLKKFS
jgi:phenylalanyl-tRNA synthetase beta chain